MCRITTMRGSRKFSQRGSTLTTFFFLFFSLMWGGMIQIPLLAILRFPDGPMMAQH